MPRASMIAVVLLLWKPTLAFAHQQDEYLQAATFAMNRDHVEVRLAMTPGVDVSHSVVADIDTNEDGAISEPEQRAYAERVRHDLSLSIDGIPSPLRLLSSDFPDQEAMKGGLGDIVLVFAADAPRGSADHQLVFENHHRAGISAYLVNTVVSRGSGLRITAQARSYQQSQYRLDFKVADTRAVPPSLAWLSENRGELVWGGLLLSGPLALAGLRKRRTRGAVSARA